MHDNEFLSLGKIKFCSVKQNDCIAEHSRPVSAGTVCTTHVHRRNLHRQ